MRLFAREQYKQRLGLQLLAQSGIAAFFFYHREQLGICYKKRDDSHTLRQVQFYLAF